MSYNEDLLAMAPIEWKISMSLNSFYDQNDKLMLFTFSVLKKSLRLS